MIIYFDNQLCDKAFKIIESTEDLIEARKDIIKIGDILGDFYTTAHLDYNYIQQYILELKNKYEEIAIINRLASRFRWKKGGRCLYNGIQCPQEIQDLNYCKYCILAHVLKKAVEIKEYAEFFDKNKIIF